MGGSVDSNARSRRLRDLHLSMASVPSKLLVLWRLRRLGRCPWSHRVLWFIAPSLLLFTSACGSSNTPSSGPVVKPGARGGVTSACRSALVPSQSASAPSAADVLPPTDQGIHLAQTFDYRVANPAAMVGKIDYIWGACRPVPGIHSDHYLAFNLAPAVHNLDWWRLHHPDWIVYKCDQKTPASYPGQSSVVLDISNPAVRAYQLGLVAAALRSGYNGIGWDDLIFTNYEGSCGIFQHGSWRYLGYPATDKSNPKLTDDIWNWLTYMHGRMKQLFPTKTMTVNFSPLSNPPDALLLAAPNVDMVFDEAAFSGYLGKRITDERWASQVAFFEYLNRIGTGFVIDDIVNAPRLGALTHSDVNWALATYLLVKGVRSYLSVRPAVNGARYSGFFLDRPEYHLPIGSPVSARYADHGLQLRKYSGGLVAVNPSSTRAASLPLARSYTDAYGASVTRLNLRPATGMVLLNK